METEAAGAVPVLHVYSDESACVALRGCAWTSIHFWSEYDAATGIGMRPQASPHLLMQQTPMHTLS